MCVVCVYSLPFNERIVFVFFFTPLGRKLVKCGHTVYVYTYYIILTPSHTLSLSSAEMDFAQTGSLVKDRHLLQRQMSATGETSTS